LLDFQAVDHVATVSVEAGVAGCFLRSRRDQRFRDLFNTSGWGGKRACRGKAAAPRKDDSGMAKPANVRIDKICTETGIVFVALVFILSLGLSWQLGALCARPCF